MESNTRRYEFHDDETNSHKFWELTATKTGFDAYYGRIDSEGQGPTSYTSEQALKKIAEKEKKGYKLV